MIFRHIRSEEGNITVALDLIDRDDNEQCTAVIGVAFCAPTDQFNKARGRLIASGRCKKAKETLHPGWDGLTVGHGYVHNEFPTGLSADRMLYSLLSEAEGPGWFSKFLAGIETNDTND